MATVNKDFKIKSGLIVEGTTATVNGYSILTKKPADDQYIIDLIGGETLVKLVSNEFDVSVAGELSLDRAVVDAYYDAAGDAAAAETAANLYTDGRETAITTAYQNYADTAETDAKAYTDTRETAITTAYQSYADTAETDAKAYADSLAANYDSAGAAAQALSDAEDYTDTAVGNLVGAAPELLNTLQELAAALDNDPDAINSLQSIAAGKQDELTAGANIDITGATISVTGLDSADISDFSTAAVTANTGLWDTIGAAQTAEDNAIAHADALDTDDIAEGTAQYFTDARAKSSAADLLTGATLSNITITGTGAGLTITAENGVAGSTTSDLAEGTNLYFTEQRALDAVSGSNIQPESVDITWVRREEATWTAVNLASTATVHSFAANKGSVKYLVRVISQGYSHVTELLATTDSSNNVALVEYGTIYTSENPLATATVVWNSATSQYNLNVTTANNAAEVLVAATLLAYND